MGTDIGDSVVAFALPHSGAAVLAQTATRTLRSVGLVFILFLAGFLVFRFAKRNWFWYTLLTILIILATFVAWLISQTVPVTLLAIFVAVVIGWQLTRWRKRVTHVQHKN